MQINGIIEKKLIEIHDWKIDSYSEFKDSSLKINAVERALTVCVEIMIDVTERILAIKQIAPKNSFIKNFRELERLNIIQSFITKRLDDFSAFIGEVRKAC